MVLQLSAECNPSKTNENICTELQMVSGILPVKQFFTAANASKVPDELMNSSVGSGPNEIQKD